MNKDFFPAVSKSLVAKSMQENETVICYCGLNWEEVFGNGSKCFKD